MSDKNVQGVPPSQHDIKHGPGGVKVPDPKNIEQGTKRPELRDNADKSEHPKP